MLMLYYHFHMKNKRILLMQGYLLFYLIKEKKTIDKIKLLNIKDSAT
jgi:hypothetical protein